LIKLNKTTEALFYFMLFSPIFSYFTFGVFGLLSIQRYLMVVIIIYGLIYVIKYNNKLSLPFFVKMAFVWFMYTFIWSFYNGYIENRGFFPVLLNHQLAVFFALIVIYNTTFRRKFITNTIFIFKITVVTTAIVSIIQVFDGSFLNAWELWRDDDSIKIDNFYEFRRTSIFGFIEQNALGLSFIPLLAVLTGYLLHKKSSLMIFYLFLGGSVALVSNTRYVMISFVIITFQILIANQNKLTGVLRYSWVIFIVGIGTYFGLQFVGYDLLSWFEQRLFREGSITETTRYAAIINFIHFFPDNYLLGNGSIMHPDIVAASKAFYSSHIHVGYLSHLVAYGIVGCAFLYGFWFLLARRLYMTAKLTNFWGSFFALTVFLIAFATFSQSSIFYYGLLYALIFDKYFYDEYKINQ